MVKRWPFTWNAVQEILASSPPEKPTEVYAGPLRQGHTKIKTLDPSLPISALDAATIKGIEDTWMPRPELTVYDETQMRPLTADEISQKRLDKTRWMPRYFQNPMQSYDYLVYESLLKNTILGPLLWSLVRFVMGTGFKPKILLNQSSGDKKKDAKRIEKLAYIIDALESVDRQISERRPNDGRDVSFNVKITQAIYLMLGFNRSVLVHTYDERDPIRVVREKNTKPVPIKELPTGLVSFHPRDIGMIKVPPETHKIQSVQIQQIQGFVPMTDCIYLWNSQWGSPIYNAEGYGGSCLMPMIESARMIRSQVSSILPTMSENMAAGLYHIFIKPEGGTSSQRQTEYQQITSMTEFGTANVIMIDPARVSFENVNFQPKIEEVLRVFESQIKYCIACFNLPQFASFDEAAANHATAVERIQLAISVVINPLRDWIGRDFADQWYDRNFRKIYADDEELLDEIRIGIEFEDSQVETLKERAEALATLAGVGVHLDEEKTEELLAIEGLEEHTKEPEEVKAEQEALMPDDMMNQNNAQKQNSSKPTARKN